MKGEPGSPLCQGIQPEGNMIQRRRPRPTVAARLAAVAVLCGLAALSWPRAGSGVGSGTGATLRTRSDYRS